MSEPLDVINDWLTRVWEQRDADAIAELLDPDCHQIGFAHIPTVGAEEFGVFHKMILDSFTDLRMEVVHAIVEKGWVAFVSRLSGVSLRTGRPVATTSQCMAKINDGRIAWHQANIDFMSLFEQTGQIPPRSFERCLSGEKIAGETAPATQRSGATST